VQRGPNGLFVYVVQPDSKVAVRSVETSETSGDAIIVTSDTLSEGDTVVTDGQSRLEPGARVTLRNASGDAKDKPAKAASSEETVPKGTVAQ
jgi:multidrug efflux system membrane fusion protein